MTGGAFLTSGLDTGGTGVWTSTTAGAPVPTSLITGTGTGTGTGSGTGSGGAVVCMTTLLSSVGGVVVSVVLVPLPRRAKAAIPPTSTRPRPANTQRRELERGSSWSVYPSGRVTAVLMLRCEAGIRVCTASSAAGSVDANGGGNVSLP